MSGNCRVSRHCHVSGDSHTFGVSKKLQSTLIIIGQAPSQRSDSRIRILRHPLFTVRNKSTPDVSCNFQLNFFGR